jgi:hypothetical protein
MKLLFNLDVIAGNRVKARPSEYLQSLPVNEQITAVTEFLHWAEQAARDNQDQQARAEAEIGIATATEYLNKLEQTGVQIYTGADNRQQDE